MKLDSLATIALFVAVFGIVIYQGAVLYKQIEQVVNQTAIEFEQEGASHSR